MSPIPDHFRLHCQPIANPDAIVQIGHARFTILTERLIRLEYDADNNFEDHATQTVWYRQQPVPEYSLHKLQDGKIEIKTSFLHVIYSDNGEGFTSDNLSIHVLETDTTWHPELVDDDNLRGTTRTLDMINGYAPLGQGLISRSGWSLLDDSTSLVFNEDYWIQPRDKDTLDWYFFGYGHDYKTCLVDYCKISGEMPLIPRWILGNWWSRYWAYTHEELAQLVCDFEAHQIPLSICIIDMDWHITETGNSSTGWTGYTWNRELFPDPEAFIQFLHDKGLRTALNLHPADGIHPHEEQYEKMAEWLGIDTTSQEPIPFNITDPEFAKAYFGLLHHPYEEIGVDFWWIDWQQGQKSPMKDLDPLWLINHLHFYDSGRDGVKRPFIFSRWGNQGHQRYPIGFSGDSYITWDTLRFQPYMTAAASNIAYGWWSHDIGGHTSGTGDAELFARWVQFGVFSPIMRIHTTKGYFYERRPWMLGDQDVFNVLRDTMQFRHQLMPYIYTMAYRAHQESLPLLLPMYYDHPEDDAAYNCPQQYMFGSELLVAPFVEPMDKDTNLSRQVVWLPEGDWYHFFSGEYFEGNSWQAIYGKLDEIPLFAKAGAIVPLGAWDNYQHPDQLEIHVFAGADHQFVIYEDDGETTAYQHGQFAKTTLQQTFSDQRMEFTIQPAQGDLSVLPSERQVSLVIHGVQDACSISAMVDGKAVSLHHSYVEETETLHIDAVLLSPRASLSVMLETDAASILARRNRIKENTLEMLGSFALIAGVRNVIADNIDEIVANPDKLAPYFVTMTDSQIKALCETLFDAGVHVIEDAQYPTQIILWNNKQDDRITYRYNDAYLMFGFLHGHHFQNGVIPQFLTFVPENKSWSHGSLDQHVHRPNWLAQVDYHQIASVVARYQEQTP